VLINIAKQAKADTKNIEMQTKAIQKFTQKFGDNNISAFQERWGDNSDSRIFQGMNIMDSNLSNDQKRKALQKIYVDENNQPLSTEEINKLRIKQQNLLKLQNSGSL
jgi:beta-N-acetylglucosaminidase